MNNPDNLNRYAYVIHAATYLNENCQTAKKRCLYFNREMYNFLGFLSHTNHFVCQDNICNINQQSNVWLLCNPTEISSLHEYNDPNVFTKQGSDEHLLQAHQARVNPANMHDALGLSSLNNQKKHYVNKFTSENIANETSLDFAPGCLTDYQRKVRYISSHVFVCTVY